MSEKVLGFKEKELADKIRNQASWFFLCGLLIGGFVTTMLWFIWWESQPLCPDYVIESGEMVRVCSSYDKEFGEEPIFLIGKAWEDCWLGLDLNKQLYWKCEGFASPIGYECVKKQAVEKK